jgi:NAD(P)H dehydrogenase (quinone)
MVEYMGIKALAPFVAYAAPRVDQAKREEYLQALRTRVLEIAADIDAGRKDAVAAS